MVDQSNFLATDGATPTKTCAICNKPQEVMFRPFCSKRCADVDLHRWLQGSYAIAAVETDEPDDEDAF